MALKRLTREFKEIGENPVANCSIEAANEDLFNWRATVIGPDDSSSPYAGGTFAVMIRFPADYPFKPPRLTFETRIFHPNVCAFHGASSDGTVCRCSGMGHLSDDEWSPHISIFQVC